jgi:hypothetical protein
MPAASDDFRATAEAIEEDLERLADVEAEKKATEAADPKATDLSIDAEKLAKRILNEATAQRELAEEANAEAHGADATNGTAGAGGEAAAG